MSVKQNRVALGTWGSRQISIEVTDTGATLDFPCANGQITEPLVLNGLGQFDVAGVYRQEHPGPVRMGEDDSQSARYTGKVEGKVLTLIIKVRGSDVVLGPFVCNFGVKTRVPKCM